MLLAALRNSRLSFTLAASLCRAPAACSCVSRLARSVRRLRLGCHSGSLVAWCMRAQALTLHSISLESAAASSPFTSCQGRCPQVYTLLKARQGSAHTPQTALVAA